MNNKIDPKMLLAMFVSNRNEWLHRDGYPGCFITKCRMFETRTNQEGHYFLCSASKKDNVMYGPTTDLREFGIPTKLIDEGHRKRVLSGVEALGSSLRGEKFEMKELRIDSH
jgi:hypothetical protein